MMMADIEPFGRAPARAGRTDQPSQMAAGDGLGQAYLPISTNF
jgi:hypothetical protein